jgi:hypothetical protein
MTFRNVWLMLRKKSEQRCKATHGNPTQSNEPLMLSYHIFLSLGPWMIAYYIFPTSDPIISSQHRAPIISSVIGPLRWSYYIFLLYLPIIQPLSYLPIIRPLLYLPIIRPLDDRLHHRKLGALGRRIVWDLFAPHFVCHSGVSVGAQMSTTK